MTTSGEKIKAGAAIKNAMGTQTRKTISLIENKIFKLKKVDLQPIFSRFQLSVMMPQKGITPATNTG